MNYQLCLDAGWQLQAQHTGAKGYITVAEKTAKWSQKHYKSGDLPSVVNGVDVYSSQNTFMFPVRKTIYVQQLRSFYIDLDCYKMGLTPDQVLWQLETDHFNSTMPTPNYVILSGRGLALVWLIRPAPAAALPLWQFTQDWLCKQLAHLGADPVATDAARVLRLAGTINSKNNAVVQVLQCHDRKLDIKDWKRDWLPEKKVKPERRIFKGKITRLFSTYTLHYERMRDIKTLVNIRAGRCDGHRELILFLFRYYGLLYLKNSKAALEAVLDLNNRFISPLPWREAIRATKSAETILGRGKKYNYTNATLIELLGITSREQEFLTTIIDTAEKYRRNNEKREKARRTAGQATREDYLARQDKVTQERLQAVKDVLQNNPSIKVKELANELNVSRQHAYRLLKEIL